MNEEIIAPYLEANRNLTKKIDVLQEMANDAWKWRERCENLALEIKELRRMLILKQQYRVVGRKAGEKDPILMALQVVRQESHDNGTDIEVLI